MHSRQWGMGLALVAVLGIAGIATAQQEPEASPATATPAATIDVDQGDYIYQYDGREPLIVFVKQATDNFEGVFITYVPMARLADGSITALTPCDDIAVACQDITTRGTGEWGTVHSGDTLVGRKAS